MKIDPKRLKALRQAKGLSRAGLAKMSKVSAKQIQRLESIDEASGAPRDWTVDRLTKALGIKPEVLSGDEPLPASESPLIPPSVRVTQRLRFGVRLAYDLVEQRYGVKATAIVNAAPLFFVLLAEGSLAWRRNELARIKEALEHVMNMAEGSNRKRFAFGGAGLALDHGGYEETAIEERNLFGDPYPNDDLVMDADYSKTTSPFSEYLQKLSEELDVPGLEIESGFASMIGLGGMPDYSVCKDELERIAPTNRAAALILEAGDVRISNIPEHLRSHDAAPQREEWLTGKASRTTIQWLEEVRKRQERLAKYRNELGMADDVEPPSKR